MSLNKTSQPIQAFRVLVILAIITLCFCGPVSAANYKFHSDQANSGVYNGNGITPNNNNRWNTSPNVLLPGVLHGVDEGNSAPAIVDGVVYFAGMDTPPIENDGYRLFAYGAGNGTRLWKSSTKIGNDQIYQASSLAVVDGIIYVGGWSDDAGSGKIIGFFANNGTERNSISITGNVQSSPNIVNNTLFFGSDFGYIFGRNAAPMTHIWQYNTDDVPVTSSPAYGNIRYCPMESCINPRDYQYRNTLVIASEENVWALNPWTGAKIWDFNTNNPGYEYRNNGASSPVIAYNTVYISSQYSNSDNGIFAIQADNGTFKWFYPTNDTMSVPVVWNNLVMSGEGGDGTMFYAINAATGTNVWTYTSPDGNVGTDAAVADGIVFIGTNGGSVIALNATTGSEVWTYTAATDLSANYMNSGIAVSNGIAYAPMAHGFYAIGDEYVGPYANFTGNPLAGTAPLTVKFTDLSTNTSTSPVSWHWSFGDGNSTNSTDQHPVHTYLNPGFFSVSLNVTNSYGSNVMTRTNYIHAVHPEKIGVVRNNKTWILDASGNGLYGAGDVVYNFGIAGDVYVTGDWNGDGKTEIGVVRNNNTWLLDASGNGLFGPGDLQYTFGKAGDVYVTGDWNRDGKTEIGVVRFNTTWLLDASGNGLFGPGDLQYVYGRAGDVYVTGDWNGNGTTKIGVIRNNKTWYLDASGNGLWGAGDIVYNYGIAGDQFVNGDWNGDGTTKIGVVRFNTTWLLDASGNGLWSPGDYQYVYGRAGDRFVTGKWS